MESEFKIDAQEGIIYAKFKGAVSLEETIAHIEEVERDPAFRSGMNTVHDLREAVLDWDYKMMDLFRDYVVEEVQERRGAIKVACLTSGGATAVVLELINKLAECVGGKIEIKLFPNKEDALKWAKEKV